MGKQSNKRWDIVLKRQVYEDLLKMKRIRLSFEAFQGCIFINIYRTEKAMQLPFQILTDIMDIDESLRIFRNRHADMVHRMIGMQIGTGGSSGYHYLRSTVAKHQIFGDLFNVSAYILELRLLPKI